MIQLDPIFLGSDFKSDVPIGKGLENHQYNDSVDDALARIDSKAGSLLTHISMMIAAATFVISADGTKVFEKVVIGAEIILYLFLALGCLRVLVYQDVLSNPRSLSGPGPDAYKAELRAQVIRRGAILNFAIRHTFLLTFIFAISLAAPLIL